MDKRTVLAITLSIMVLIVYNIITPKPPVRIQPEAAISSDLVENESNVEVLLPDSTPTSGDVKTSGAPEISLESDNLILKVSPTAAELKKIELKSPSYLPPISQLVSLDGYQSSDFKIVKTETGATSFQFENSDFAINVSYEVSHEFVFHKFITVKNKSELSKVVNLELILMHLETSSLDNDKSLAIERDLFEYSILTPSKIFRKRGAIKFSDKEKISAAEEVNWIGYRNRYFSTIIKPEYPINSYEVAPIDAHNLEIRGHTELKLAPKESVTLKNLIYNGPQDINLLKKVDPSFVKIMSFKIGGFMDVVTLGTTDIIGMAILNILNFVHKFVHNWGISIIVLGILMYGITYPLTAKSLASARMMQSLQPEVAKIKEQSKGNQQKMNKEIMELYKKHNFNPLSGCLPVLLQMPIFISLYQVLWRTYNFKGAHFLWIKDLSLPDKLFTLPFSIPFMGNEVNLLPVIVMIAMFMQQKSNTKMSTVTDPEQLMQQKIMTTVMPIMIGVVFYRVASGLALYFSTFYILSTLGQMRLNSLAKIKK